MLRSQPAFRRFAWGLLGYTVLVILWGGYVRASGSGAGCGDHWPLCNGVVIPHSPALNTIIEFSHRLTSALAGLLSLLLVVWAWRACGRGSAPFMAGVAAFFFMMLEAAIGAGLVLFEMVAYNPSIARAYWMAAHLVNTFFLLAALTLTAWTASGGTLPRFRGSGSRGGLLGASLLGMLLLGASGAVTALGDTLAIGGGLDPAAEAVVGTLVGLRIYHPMLAIVVFVVVGLTVLHASRAPSAFNRRHPGWSGQAHGPLEPARSAVEVSGRGAILSGRAASNFGGWLVVLMAVQLGVGLLNVRLQAPIWIQMVHLLTTDAIWICLILFASTTLAARARVEE